MNCLANSFDDHYGDLPDEKIAVRRIRVINCTERTTAVVASFFTVDRVLCNWLRGAGTKVLDCDFEIVYADGVVLSGHYHFQRKGNSGRRPALMPFVCKHIAASCDGGKPAVGFPLRGLTALPGTFLERYETEDFARLRATPAAV